MDEFFEIPLRKQNVNIINKRVEFAKADSDKSTYRLAYLNDVIALLSERRDLLKTLTKIRDRFLEISQKESYPDNSKLIAWAQYQDCLEALLDRFEE